MTEDKKIEKILCPRCGTSTNHEVVWESKNMGWEDEEFDMWVSINFDVLQCLGCETPTLRKKVVDSENLEIKEVNGENIVVPEITRWPKTGHRMLKTKYVFSAPPNIRRIYTEIVEAYNSELPTLCAAGIRAVIEAICKEQGIIEGNLEKKIDVLREKGVINLDFSSALHENRFLGNEAIHEFTLFGDAELKPAIELIETLIEMVYEAKEKARRLKNMRESKREDSDLIEE